MTLISWTTAIARRRTTAVATTAAAIAIAVALLASIGGFLSASKATMTQRSIQRVPVDWQVQVAPTADPAAVLSTVVSQPGVLTALPVGYGRTSGLRSTVSGSTQTTGPGYVLGIPLDYATVFPGELRVLSGATSGVLLAQQTAANLHAAPGDAVAVTLPDGTVADLTVDGVVDLPQADALFQTVGAPPGASAQAPPDNVVLIPADRWHQLYDAIASRQPDQAVTQIHTEIRHDLPADPSAAYVTVTGRARNLEAKLAGGGLVGDTLGATLAAARSDALYAQILFLFLGLPGAALAAFLTVVIAQTGADRRRRDQALLRARGATAPQLVRLGVAEAALVGGIGTVLGLVAAQVVARTVLATPSAAAGVGLIWQVAAAAVGLLIAAAAIAVPAWRDAHAVTVVGARRRLATAGRPLWLRWGVDLWLLALSALVFWVTSRGGYALVLAPEGTPQISVNYWAFAGPALLWLGVALLTWRLTVTVLQRGRGAVVAGLRGWAGSLAGPIASTLERRRKSLARGVVLLALILMFAASTAVFNATYRQQARVDAVLTNGADVAVTESPGVSVGPDQATGLAGTPGVVSVEPLQHRNVYVGADLQDLYGVRPSTIVDAGQLQDAYFAGGTARALMGTLASRPDSVLVSAETVRDFQLSPGDRLNLRLQDGRTQQFTTVPFTYAGVAKEFPTAPSDSFVVANADYVARTTGSDAVGTFLIDTGGADQDAVAQRLRQQLGTSASVTAITESQRLIGSSLTAVDLGGLTRVELGFAAVLTAAAAGLVIGLDISERKRFFAIIGALGAHRRDVAKFVTADSIVVGAGGLLAGSVAGWALTEMLVKVLTGVFDPPPAALAVPWTYLGAVAAVGAAAFVAASAGSLRQARHPSIALLRAS